MQFIQRYHDNSLVYGSAQADRLAQAAKDHDITVVMGTARSRAAASTWASGSSAPTARRSRKRRKLKPTHVERTVFGEGRRQRPGGARHAARPVGALCCWEHLQPLSKYAMYAQNEQVHIAAWPSFSLYRGGAYALGPR
jgi:aliphatic nitrilase